MKALNLIGVLCIMHLAANIELLSHPYMWLRKLARDNFWDLPDSFGADGSSPWNLEGNIQEEEQPEQDKKMQGIVPVVVNILAQDLVVYLNFFTHERRVRVQVHYAALAEHFAQPVALE